jgi:cytochrome c-553
VKAEKVYKRSCATCHGKQGEKPAMGESKIINQLKPEEILTALSERKAGNITGAGNPAKQRLSEQDIHNLSEYIQTLK